MLFEKAKIYGVDGVGQASPSLTRTDDAVGLSVSVGASEIQSDFDNCFPWNEMQEVTDSSSNVFIRIPKFYSKITKNANGTYKHQISGTRYSGFSTLFIDGKGNELDYIDVGKYEASGSSSRAYSKTGQTVLVNITINNLRTACRANGSGYQQYDFLIDMILKELFLVEMATTNSQSIMKGFSDSGNTAALTTGYTDAVKTPSGSPTSNTTGTYAMKYRGIENLWGNTWTFCDGISFATEKVFVCTDPTQYDGAKTTMPYSYMGDRPTSGNGYIKKLDTFAKNPLISFISELGGSDSTYYCDYSWYAATGVILLVGGSWYFGSNDGLWSWLGDIAVGLSGSDVGGRLCYKPL